MVNSFWIALVCMVLLFTPALSHASKTHKVKKNETLYSISKKYRVAVAELKSANNLVNSHINIGDKLVIPPRSTAEASESSRRGGKSRSSVYKVRKGDTLTRVARKTGVSVRELKRINGMVKNRLMPGQVLALKGDDGVEETKAKPEKRLTLRNGDLFNERDYEESLAELTESESGQEVDLSKNVELKTDNVALLKSKAFCFLGTNYRFGGSSLNGIDCSAFVQQVFREMSISLPRTAREQFKVGFEVSPGDLQKGDLVFFRTYASYPSHVGIYLGNSKMIHASSREHKVVISTMDTPYYRARFIGAKRISKINPDVFRFDDLFTGVEEESVDDATNNDTLDVGLN